MPTVVALWPDNTTSVVVLEPSWTPLDLFYELDHIGDPLAAKVWILKRQPEGSVHVTFDWNRRDEHRLPMDLSGSADVGQTDQKLHPKTKGLRIKKAGYEGKVKRFEWPAGIVRQFLFASWRDAARNPEAREAILAAECGKLLNTLPTPPPPLYTARDVNAMDPFSGVYIAWNSDGTAHYVGESINVPSRVQASRPEIGDRMVGVLHCDKNDRLRIEALFVGLLNPAGNGASNLRAAQRDSQRSKRVQEATDGTHS
jgi:hypothetical protein